MTLTVVAVRTSGRRGSDVGEYSRRWLHTLDRIRVFSGLDVGGRSGHSSTREQCRRPHLLFIAQCDGAHQPYRVGHPRSGRETRPNKAVGPYWWEIKPTLGSQVRFPDDVQLAVLVQLVGLHKRTDIMVVFKLG